MNISELKEKFSTNIEVLKRLEEMYKNNDSNYDSDTILESIIKLQEEQNELSNTIRRNIYKNVSKKTYNTLMKNEKEEKEVKEEKIIVMPKKVDMDELVKDASISFDGDYYTLTYNNGKDSVVSAIMFDNENSITFDYNIIGILKEFDNKHKTSLYDKYMNNEIPVKYNFDHKFTDRRVRNVRKIARSGKKYYDNIEIVDTRGKKLRARLAAASVAAAALLAGFGITKNVKNRSVSSRNNEMVTEVSVNEASTTESVTTEEIIQEIKDKKVDKTNDKKVKDDTIDMLEKEPLIELPEPETNIGDVVRLGNDVDLYYASTDELPRGNTSNLDSDNYRIGLISVVYNNRVVKYVDQPYASLETIKNECSIRYGNDVKVFVNVDLIDENNKDIKIKYAGWVNCEDLYSSKILKLKK